MYYVRPTSCHPKQRIQSSVEVFELAWQRQGTHRAKRPCRNCRRIGRMSGLKRLFERCSDTTRKGGVSAQVRRDGQAQALNHPLGPGSLVTLGMGNIIGAGIFVLTDSTAAIIMGPTILWSI